MITVTIAGRREAGYRKATVVLKVLVVLNRFHPFSHSLFQYPARALLKSSDPVI